MDKIFIRGLELEAIVGVHGWERQIARPLVLDLDLGVDMREAAASDQVRDAVDYDAVCQRLRRLVGERQPALLETLAEGLARTLFAEFPLLSLRLAIHKPGAVPGVKDLGVEIDRRREDYAVCGR